MKEEEWSAIIAAAIAAAAAGKIENLPGAQPAAPESSKKQQQPQADGSAWSGGVLIVLTERESGPAVV